MAIKKMTMPQLGESVTEGTISKWLVAPGDFVHKYDPVAEVMTDKVNAEVPSSYTGKIIELIASEDDTLEVGEVICTIQVEGAESETQARPENPDLKTQPGGNGQQEQDKSKNGKVRYSPAVLKLSQEHGIDLSKISGTGKEGRITRKDILKLVEAGKTAPEPAAGETKQAAPETIVPPKQEAVPAPVEIHPADGDRMIPVSGVRKAIANNMLRSKHEIPHAWMMMEVDVTNLVQYRDALKADFKQREGFNLTYFAFFVKAISQALKEFPQINSTWAGDQIIEKHEVNISIAVAAEDALFVPVIKRADEKSIKGIARDITDLAQKARTGALKQGDMKGGTFTVNNTGSFGSVQSMGIINYPQAAILQVESIVKRPVVMNNGMIAVRDMVNLCMSLDHRILDGLICGRFLKRVKEILEAISPETTPIY
ncbi:dihydrolipoamide acetyltransferase family protein [Heyndrickxia acidiproducens]|uniref:dihydrolipoamide acetyltransferase family protein n=1 Tax=Heyndrickxia acidiproducens TaxID=1121084 RepID=UPI000370BB0B|nr:dihydrolipoamide acetyltransferase family protein [Heyndrickxia acidiproducens]